MLPALLMSIQVGKVVSGFIGDFAKIVLQAFAAFTSITGFAVNGLGQISRSVFGNLNIVNETNFSLQRIGESVISVQSGLQGVVGQSSSAGVSIVGSAGGSITTSG